MIPSAPELPSAPKALPRAKVGITRFVRILREFAALLLWTLVIVKLLVFDVDIYVVERFAPRAQFFLPYKFFGIIGAIAFLWLVLGNSRFRAFVLYIIFYPFIVILWKVPKLLFRNWAIAIVFSPALYSVFTTLRLSFISTTITIIAALLIVISNDAIIIGTSMILLLLYLIVHFFKRFRMAFQPSSVFSTYAGLIRSAWKHIQEIAITKRFSEIERESANQDKYRKLRQDHWSWHRLPVKVKEV